MDPKDTPTVEDDAALDAELAASLNDVRAGKELEPKAPAKVEEEPKENAGEPAPAADPTPEDPSNPPAPEKKDEFELRIPNKGKFESDESYEKRIELFDLVKRRKAADTPEKKAALSEQIASTKSQLKNLNGSDKLNNLNSSFEEPKPKVEDEDPALVADRERLKQLGGATKEDIQEVIRQERALADTQNTLASFVDRHPEFKDEDVREVFFNFVDQNYNWNGKSGKELMTVLELARESMFKPSETIQDRVLKGANVAEKVNAMQFPGGTNVKVEYSGDMRKSIDELKATGMSEEKAVELLSD